MNNLFNFKEYLFNKLFNLNFIKFNKKKLKL